jgi:hypothetical protein
MPPVLRCSRSGTWQTLVDQVWLSGLPLSGRVDDAGLRRRGLNAMVARALEPHGLRGVLRGAHAKVVGDGRRQTVPPTMMWCLRLSP